MPKTIRLVQWPLLTVLHKTIIELTSYFIVNRKKSSLFCTMQYKRNPSLQSKFNLVTFFCSVLSQKHCMGMLKRDEMFAFMLSLSDNDSNLEKTRKHESPEH